MSVIVADTFRTRVAGAAVTTTEGLNVGGATTVAGAVVATSFAGDGSSITALSGSNISSGTVAAARLPSDLNTTGTAGGLTGTPNIAVGNITGVAATFTGVLTYEDVTNVDSVGVITARGGIEIGASGVGGTISPGGNVKFTGITTVGAGLSFADDIKAKFGAGGDLSVYHDGSNSYIKDAGTGALIITTSNLQVNNPANDENLIWAGENDRVELYHNGNKKFETTIEGTVTTGIATVTAIDGGISAWVLGANGTNHYTFTGPGNLNAADDPQIELQRGQTYVFRNRSGGHPFRIQSTVNGSTGTQYSTGVTNNDGGDGTDIIFDVPFDAPNILYYQCTSHANMGGVMLIGERGIPANTQTGAYVLVADDAGKTIYISTGGVTINNSLFSEGDAVTIINNSGSNQTITQGSGVTLYDTGDDGSTGNKTLKGRGMCTVWFASASVGYISGNFD